MGQIHGYAGHLAKYISQFAGYDEANKRQKFYLDKHLG